MTAAPNDSYWTSAIEQAQARLEPALDAAETADVVCVGGGYTSLVTAYLLKKRDPSLDVAILEGNHVGFGSSGRNGGMVLHEPHLERLPKHGADTIRFTYDETVRAIDFIDELAREEDFDCELERTGYLEIALHSFHRKEQAAKQKACREIGIELDVLDETAMQQTIKSERFTSALVYPKAAMLHPGKYVAGLKRAVLRRGVRLYENSPVQSVRPESAAVAVATAAGSISAAKLVLGLNAYHPASGIGIVRDRAVTLFSFIILTEPLSERHWKAIGWRGRQGYTDGRRDHNYVRLTGDRILFGGRVQYHFGLESPADIDKIFAKLHDALLETFPSLHDVGITHRWCGPVAITWRRTPMIGSRENDNLWFALGYSGMGVSLATLCGRALADLVTGREEPWSDLLYLKDPLMPLPPEPLRFIGFKAGYLGMRFMDLVERFR